MANNLNEKVTVLNPIVNLHTVGQDLMEAFKAKGVDVSLMHIANISKKEHLTKKQMTRAMELLGLDSTFITVLEKSQEEYQIQKEKCQASYKTAKLAFRKLKPVLPMLRNEFNSGYDRLDDILDFFGVDSEEEIFEHVKNTGILYRTQNRTTVNEINLAAWLRRGELDFEKRKDTLSFYNEKALIDWIDKREWSKELEHTTYYKSIPKLLSRFGVCVALIPYLENTVYGAVKWEEGHPIVMISDRDQDLATCWFTLFHELGHVILHKNELSIDGMINEHNPPKKIDKRERDANKFANKYLFNGDSLRKHIFELKHNGDYESQDVIASAYNVERIFVGYWMKKAQYYPAQHHHVPISFFE